MLGVGYREIPNVRLPAERATSSLLRSIGGVVGLREGRAARAARSSKRQQLFEECDEIPWKGGGLSTEDIVAMVREGRDRLSDRDWLALDPFSSQEESAKAVTL